MLEGKYIIINRNQMRMALDLLYREGYTWNLRDYSNEYVKDWLITNYNKIFIVSRKNKRLYFYSDTDMMNKNENCLQQLNINIFLREYKLKRILK